MGRPKQMLENEICLPVIYFLTNNFCTMKRLLLSWTVVAVAVTSCQKEVVYNDTPVQNQSVELVNSCTRSYDEALAIAEDALNLLEGE